MQSVTVRLFCLNCERSVKVTVSGRSTGVRIGRANVRERAESGGIECKECGGTIVPYDDEEAAYFREMDVEEEMPIDEFRGVV